MNRTDRMLGIVLELQSSEYRRAEDLAAAFEVSKRTIYRDIQALAELGIPIMAMTGYGYSLMEGFFLPPLTFDSRGNAASLLAHAALRDRSFLAWSVKQLKKRSLVITGQKVTKHPCRAYTKRRMDYHSPSAF